MSRQLSVTATDLRRMLDIVDRDRLSEPGAPLPWCTLTDLANLIGSDTVSYVEQDPTARRVLLEQDSQTQQGGEIADADLDPSFWDWFWACQACSYPLTTADRAGVRMLHDFYSWDEFARQPMAAHFRANGASDEIIVPLVPDGATDRRLVFWSAARHRFGERERLLLELLRPHLIGFHNDVLRHRDGTPELTSRQWELMRLVAQGLTNTQIAHRLVVSEGTVRKHLENVYARLAVNNRTAAVARAFPDGIVAA